MPTQPIDAYRKVQKLALGPSGAEAEALTKAALLLDGARDRMDDYPGYASALRFNQVLWTLIQADVAEEANRLPDDVKSDLLSLSLFVDTRTVRALAEPKAEHLAALIEIDRNIARGLRAQGKDPGTALAEVQDVTSPRGETARLPVEKGDDPDSRHDLRLTYSSAKENGTKPR